MTDFSDLQTIQLPKSACDEDINFLSDMLYFKALLNEIVQMAYALRQANPLPSDLSSDLAEARFWWPTDKAQQLLDGWHE
jgi:hypothetical protein